VDAAGATAQLDKGVLQLTLPKKAGGQARRLAIQ
jgi:HSP20 family molecular chaperone IbpA